MSNDKNDLIPCPICGGKILHGANGYGGVTCFCHARLPAKTMTTDNFTPHLGGECPVAYGTLINVKFRDGAIHPIKNPAILVWSHNESDNDIIGWRLAESSKPQEQVHGDWVLVPREPTRDMMNAWLGAGSMPKESFTTLYKAMLSASPQPSQTLSEPVAEIFQNKYGLPEVKFLGGIKYATTIANYPTVKLYTHAPDSAQAILALEADKSELLEALKDVTNKLYSNSKLDALIAKMEGKK